MGGMMMKGLLKELAVYDWITILYIIVGIACFIWVSTGNEYIFNKIEKRMDKNPELDCRKARCDLYYLEIRKSWLHNQNIWIAVEYFLIGLAYLSTVIVIYMAVDNIIQGDLLKTKTAFYTIINLLASTFRDYLMPRKKALGARKAYLLLNRAIINYENGEGSLEELLNAFDQGEQFMTESTYEE